MNDELRNEWGGNHDPFKTHSNHMPGIIDGTHETLNRDDQSVYAHLYFP
jgi:hypothetical protein